MMADKRAKVGVDLDGVVAQFSPTFIKMANEKFGLNMTQDKQTGWQFQCQGLTVEQENSIWEDIENTPNWWGTLPPFENASDLEKASKVFRLYFITSRVPTKGLPLEDQAANWLRAHFGITFPTVIVSDHKGPIASALNLDYFIDDRDKNCLAVRAFSPFTKVFINDAPYNQDFVSGSVERAYGLNDFFNKIGGVSGSAESVG